MGVKTLYEYFYKLAYGDKGADKATLVNDCLDVADAEIKANKDEKHTRNADTHLGTVDANINMNSHKLTSLAIPSANGDSVRATTKITEANLESAVDHKALTNDPHSVTKTQVGLSNVVNLKIKLDATAAPGVSNDNTEGYAIGSRWVDITADKAYICLDASTGSAVWTETTGAGVDTSGTPVDNDFAKFTDADTIEGRSYSETMKDLNPITTKTGTATLTVAEAGTVLVSAASAYTLTLPTASGNTGLTYHFIKTDANYNLITLEGDGAETFNYENSTGTPNLTYLRLNTYCAEVTVVSDGSNWQVMDEAMGQVPECRVSLGTEVSNLTDTTITLVDLDTEDYDIGSNFNTTTHRFVVPIPGKYLVVNAVGYINTVADMSAHARLHKNDALASLAKAHTGSGGATTLDCKLLDVFSLAVSDYLESKAYVVAGVGTVDVQNAAAVTFMLIKLISKD